MPEETKTTPKRKPARDKASAPKVDPAPKAAPAPAPKAAAPAPAPKAAPAPAPKAAAPAPATSQHIHEDLLTKIEDLESRLNALKAWCGEHTSANRPGRHRLNKLRDI